MPRETGKLFLAWDLPHAPETVWRALTQPQWIERWLIKTDMPAETGKAFTFRMDPTPYWDGVIHSEILVLEAPRRLSYTWKSGSGNYGLGSVVAWSLSPTEGGTRLELEHSGFRPLDDQAYAGAQRAWERNVGKGLVAVLKVMD